METLQPESGELPGGPEEGQQDQPVEPGGSGAVGQGHGAVGADGGRGRRMKRMVALTGGVVLIPRASLRSARVGPVLSVLGVPGWGACPSMAARCLPVVAAVADPSVGAGWSSLGPGQPLKVLLQATRHGSEGCSQANADKPMQPSQC